MLAELKGNSDDINDVCKELKLNITMKLLLKVIIKNTPSDKLPVCFLYIY